MAIYTKEQSLAYDLAKALDDKKHFGFYAKLAKNYSEGFIRGVLGNCLEAKNWRLVKRKGAYFTEALFNQLKLNRYYLSYDN